MTMAESRRALWLPLFHLDKQTEAWEAFAAVMTNALEIYLEELRAIRSSGAAFTLTMNERH